MIRPPTRASLVSVGRTSRRAPIAAAALGVVASVILLSGGKAAHAADSAAAVDDSAPIVEVLTFGPGNHPFTRFGHDAIRVVDAQAKTDLVYNFGTFTIAAPHLISDFLNARLRYWLSRGRTAMTLADYQHDNRTIVTQRLNLDPAARRELARRLEVNALPANRDYRYDYFHDNCATRVRDALDGVLGGRLRAVGRQPGTMSLRDHALRMAADNVPLYLGLLIVLGPSTDGLLDRWGEDFLPEMLQATLRDVRVDGPDRPLVAEERTVFTARRAPPRPAPPSWGVVFLAAGVAAGLALFGLGWAARRSRAVRIVFGVVVGLLGALVGWIGAFLFYAWMFTPHAVVYRNQNILLFAPFALAGLVIGPAVSAGSRRATGMLWWIAVAALVTTAVACVLKLPGLPHQGNGALILTFAPFWLGLALGTRALRRSLD